jgi:hypothetical protein
LSRSQNNRGIAITQQSSLTGRYSLIVARHPHPRVNQQTLASVNQHRHRHFCRDILNLIVARLSSGLSRHNH